MIILRYIYMFLVGNISFQVEGFFIERFINLCNQKNIKLYNIKKDKYILNADIIKENIEELDKIADITKLELIIKNRKGLPFLIEKYKNRKIYFIAIILIIFIISYASNFIWKINIYGNEKISNEDVMNLLELYGIYTGCNKNKIDKENIINDIRMNNEEISWIGIEISGTILNISIEEKEDKIEIKDKENFQNIIAKEDAIITKMIVQSGTACKKIGDKVNKGDILVEAVMNSQLYGTRNVAAEAIILGESTYEISKNESFKQNIKNKTGNKEEKLEININNFKINFNKGVSKFKIYDTISSNKNIKLFSKINLPIMIKKTILEETEEIQKTFSKDELTIKILQELESELEEKYNISKFENKMRYVEVFNTEDGLNVILTYKVVEEIGSKSE